MTKPTGKEAAEFMSNFVNQLGNSKELKDFVEAMSCEHRTLQQDFTKLCFLWIQNLAAREDNKPGCLGFDARNEASVIAAKKIVASTDKYGFNLPTI